jgi:hypothetical protein
VRHIRTYHAAAIAGLAAGGMLVSGAFAATRAKAPTERITLFSASPRGGELPIAVEASGPIHGIGTETQTETPTPGGQINHATLHLPDGTVRLIAPERFAWQPDLRACAAKAHGGGTFKITGGTGAYRNATGRGTFTDKGVLVGARDHKGNCLGRKAQPAVIYLDVVLTGNATVKP